MPPSVIASRNRVFRNSNQRGDGESSQDFQADETPIKNTQHTDMNVTETRIGENGSGWNDRTATAVKPVKVAITAT
jgi:hypothetical protein